MNRFVSLACSAVVGCFALSGCAEKTSAPPVDQQKPSASNAASTTTWEIYRLQGHRVGYGCTTTRRESEAGRPVVRTESVGHLAIQRGGETSRQDMRVMSVETPEGTLLRFESETRMGPEPMRIAGRVRGDRLDLEVLGPGAKMPKKTSIAWSPDFRGPFAGEQSMVRRPMQPGEHRMLKMLMPAMDTAEAATLDMKAKTIEPTPLADGSRDLLRIETVTRMAGGPRIEGVAWCDRAGETMKNVTGGLETLRVSKDEAMKDAGSASFDLLSQMMVRVDPPLDSPRETTRVRYRVRLDGGDPSRVFAIGPSQTVKRIDAHAAEITVDAIRPGRKDGNRNAPADPPTKNDLRPNDFIQSDDPLIVANAKKAAGDEKDPWRVAKALERFVHRDVKDKDFSQAFATAAEVARTHEGDCTEHAVYLAALCRARGIPARVAVGLVYLDGTQSFFYHLWTEAFIDGRWIPIDGTQAQGGIAADHLKIADSGLTGASAYGVFLPVAEIVGRLKIDVVEAK